ncbi:MAG: aminotransferase class V-fold PLP-dependent enzyme [Chthoniobacter sp.]
MLYFDHNATHPLRAWLARPGSTRRSGSSAIPRARTGSGRGRGGAHAGARKLAGWLGCEPREIVWTSGATEANNAAIHSAAANGAKEVWISAIEHPCALAATERYFGKGRREIPVTPAGGRGYRMAREGASAQHSRAGRGDGGEQ